MARSPLRPSATMRALRPLPSRGVGPRPGGRRAAGRRDGGSVTRFAPKPAWVGGLAEWIEGDTAYLSVAFTWRLPDERAP